MWRRIPKPSARPAAAAGTALMLALVLGAHAPAWAAPGYLGVNLQDLDDALIEALDLGNDTSGVLVNEVIAGSPAEDAGLRRGDVITQFGDDPVRNARSLTRMIGHAQAGDSVTLHYVRKGEAHDTTVTLGKRPRERELAPRAEAMPHGRNLFVQGMRPRLGVRVEEVGHDLGHYFGVDDGLLVLEVYDDSAAKDAGIQVGDVLLKVGDEAVNDADDLREALADHDEGDKVAVELMRDHDRTTVEVEVREPDRIDIGGLMGEGHPRVFQFDTRDFRPPGRRSLERVPWENRWTPNADDDLHEQIDQLREQLEKLTDEVQKLKDQ